MSSLSSVPILNTPPQASTSDETLRQKQWKQKFVLNRLSTGGATLYQTCQNALVLGLPESHFPLNPLPDHQSGQAPSFSDEEKKKNPLLKIPPSLFGYMTIPLAYALVHLPILINRLQVGGLNPTDKAYIENMKIGTLKASRYTPEEYAQKVKQATALLNSLKTAEGQQAFANSAAVKYFLSKHCNPETNRAVAVARLKQQVVLEALFLKYGREIHRLQDMDGTQVFKNFSSATNHVEPNISDKDRLAHYLTIAYNAKSREALNYSYQNRNNPDFTTQNMVKELQELNFFQAEISNTKKAKPLSTQQKTLIHQYLNTWAKNTDEAFPHFTQDQLRYALLSALESANTARAGWKSNTNNEALVPNDITGWGVLQHKYDLKAQMGYFEMLGLDRRPDLPLQYAFNINGFQGKTIADKQLYHDQGVIHMGYSGLHEKLRNTPMYDKIFKQKTLPRQIEFKGNYGQYDKELVTDHLNWRADKITPNSPEMKWIQAQEGFDQAQWDAKDPYTRAKWVNFMDMMMQKGKDGKAYNSRPPLALPQAWVTEMDKLTKEALALLTDEELNAKNGSPDYSVVIQLLKQRTRALDATDHEYFESPHLEVVPNSGGQLQLSKQREKLIERYTQDALNHNDVIPMGQKFLKRITELEAKGATKEEVQDLIQEINTVDFGCFTVHSILAHLQGVYDTWQNQQNRFKELGFTHELVGGNPQTGVLEAGKFNLINLLAQAAEDPQFAEFLRKEGKIMMKINSSSPNLRYKLDDPAESLITIMNNSGTDLTHEVFPGVTLEEATASFLKVLADPTASYFEGSFIEIDKGAVISPLQNITRITHMAGDSTGSDMKAIAYLSTLHPLNTSEVVRGMIDNKKLMNDMIDVMNFDKMPQKQIDALKKEFKRNGLPEQDMEAAVQTATKQLLANPLRYKKDEKGIYLVGAGHDEVLKILGHAPDKRFTTEEYRSLFKQVYNDVLLPTVFHSDDVGHKHLRDALAKGFVHGEEDQVLRFLQNTHLAKGFLDSIEGFDERGANSVGMPFNSGFTLKDWQPELHKIVNNAGKTIERNVYSPIHALLLRTAPFAMRGAEAGGLLAAVGGLIGAGATYLQLQEHAKYQKLHSWERPPQDDNTKKDSFTLKQKQASLKEKGGLERA